MTEIEKIRQAISILECMAIDLTGCIGGLSKKNPLEDVCRQRIEAINTAQSALREKLERSENDGWISVEERLPEKNAFVLCFCRNSIYDVFRFDYTDRSWISKGRDERYFESFVTHWQPLPLPPKEESQCQP